MIVIGSTMEALTLQNASNHPDRRPTIATAPTIPTDPAIPSDTSDSDNIDYALEGSIFQGENGFSIDLCENRCTL